MQPALLAQEVAFTILPGPIIPLATTTPSADPGTTLFSAPGISTPTIAPDMAQQQQQQQQDVSGGKSNVLVICIATIIPIAVIALKAVGATLWMRKKKASQFMSAGTPGTADGHAHSAAPHATVVVTDCNALPATVQPLSQPPRLLMGSRELGVASLPQQLPRHPAGGGTKTPKGQGLHLRPTRRHVNSHIKDGE